MNHVKKMIVLAALAASSIGGAQAATTLAATDFAFTGVNVNTTVGGWSFVSFVDISAGTTIYFTDTNVLQTTPVAGVFGPAETFWSWTAASNVAAGTSVALLGTGISGAYVAKSGAAGGSVNGTVSNLNGAVSNISSSGDILYAFQAASYATNYAPSAITFLGALANRATPYATSDNPFVATGLSGIQVREYRANNATTRYSQFTAQTTGSDTPFGSMAALKTALAAEENWTTVANSNSTPIVSDVLAVTVTAVPEPSSYALLLAGLGVVGAVARRRQRG